LSDRLRSSCRSWLRICALVSAAWGLAVPASAQMGMGMGMGTGLVGLPGQNDLQSTNAAAIERTCNQIATAGTTPGTPTDDLLGRCTDMINNGFDLLQGTPASSATLGMTAAETNEAITQLNTTQTSSQGIQSLEGAQQRFDVFTARLLELRGGATGISMKGLGDGGIYAFRNAFGGAEDRWESSLWENSAAGSDGDGAAQMGRLGVFLNGVVQFGQNDPTDFQAGYDYNVQGITAGADWRLTDSVVAGLAFNWRNDETRYDSASKARLGKLDDTALGGTVYLSVFQDGFYADLIGAFASHDFDLERRIVYGNAGTTVDRTAKSSPQANEWSWALGTGWDFDLPWVQGMTLGPLFDVQWIRLEVDPYTESGAAGLDLSVRGQVVKSFSTVLGGKWSYSLSTPIGVITPQVRASWQYEFQNDPRQIKVSFVNDPFGTTLPIVTSNPERSWANIGASLSMTLPFNLTAFGDYEGIYGRDRYTSHLFTFGVRAQFF
jgi:outer membrane lipase/esterase